MNPQQLLKRYWGFDKFRPVQKEIVDSAVAGHDTLGLMPTGGGKSIAFQIPGLWYGGLSIVVTPLVSLMKDQVDNLRRRGIKAVYFHSAMTSREIRMAWDRLTNDGCNFLYLAPERLRNNRFLQELRHLPIKLIVVDEAHCISQWGYDFRPSYLGIRELRRIAPHAPVLALTATATPTVANDICHELEFKPDANTICDSFARDNINYLVRPTAFKLNETIHILSRTQGSAIVYVRSRKRSRQVAEALTSEGIPATWYHAGLPFEIKEERQNCWKEGNIRVIVATNAFGMGIDKPDVRVVIHYDHPPSLEEYYQEAGRAGRDGGNSYAVLLRGERDKATLRRHVTEAFPTRDFIRKTYERICVFFGLETGEGYGLLREFDFQKFCTVYRLDETQCEAALRILTRADLIEYIEEKETCSRMMVLADRDELYHAGVDGTEEKTLTAALRNYTGLFAGYVFIFESKLAIEASLSEPEVCEALVSLSKQGLISYIPRTRTPYIYFPTAREETEHILIPKSVYETRKEALTSRTEAMIEYSYSTTGCRVKRMLAYFGEQESSDCGKCDICRDKKRKAPDLNLIASRVDEYVRLHPNGFSIAMFSSIFGDLTPEAFRHLQSLLDNGMISVDETGFYSPTSE